jgi:PAP_fibrillin
MRQHDSSKRTSSLPAVVVVVALSLCLLGKVQAFGVLLPLKALPLQPTRTTTTTFRRSNSCYLHDKNSHQLPISSSSSILLKAYYDEQSPSDYDTTEVLEEKRVEVDKREEDGLIRDALKRELLLLSSVTNRGEYAGTDEQNMLIDLVAQLEALNPTADPAANSVGEWDLCLASTQFFRSSPFFQSLRAVAGDENKQMMETAFDIHDRATTSGRVGRVRQTVTADQLISTIDLEVGLFPGLPIKIKGAVVTVAALRVTGSDSFETQIESTSVTGSNIPLLNQVLDEYKFEVPVSDIYVTLAGKVPMVPNKIFYLDEGMRITRDQDDNFFVYTRA